MHNSGRGSQCSDLYKEASTAVQQRGSMFSCLSKNGARKMLLTRTVCSYGTFSYLMDIDWNCYVVSSIVIIR
jgi:hypothetical protein